MGVIKLAIDFDSVKTNIYMLGSGMVLSEPTVAAVGIDGKDEIKAFGEDAKKLIGKTSENTKIVFPVFEGEIVNEKVASKLLTAFLRKIGIKSRLANVHAVMSVPCGASSDLIQKYSLIASNSGISKVYFVEAPILAALGQRLPLTDSSPCFLVDMAGGTTNIAAVSLDGIIAGISVNFGANKISTDIIDYIAENFGLQIGLLTAERLKKEIGSLYSNDGLSTVVNGRDIKTGTPRAVSIKAADIFEPTKIYYDKVCELVMAVLVKLPPEVSAEIRHKGIYFSGEASMVYGLEQYYADKFQIQVNVSENADMSVAFGGGIAMGDQAVLNKISIKTK